MLFLGRAMKEKVNNFLLKYWAEIFLLAIILVGLILRLYHLNFQECFAEELLHLDMIQGTWCTPFTQIGSEQAPLYYLFTKVSATILNGLTLVSLRLPAAIFGTLCIPAIYVLGKEFHGKVTGLLAAMVIALSERQVFYSQYGRPYTLAILFFIFAAYCFIRLQKNKGSDRWLLLFTITSVLCLWSHYYSIIPLSVFWLVITCQNKKKVIPYLVVIAGSSIMFIIYIWVVIQEYLTLPISSIHPQSVFNFTWIDMLIRVPYECWGYLGILLIPLFIICLLRRRDRVTDYLGLAVVITYSSLVIGTFISNAGARYAVMIAPLIIVPAMVPISEFIQNRRDRLQKIVLFGGIVYIILVMNLCLLIAWYTTAYHFVFI
jgi:uncharacterized membrane protein